MLPTVVPGTVNENDKGAATPRGGVGAGLLQEACPLMYMDSQRRTFPYIFQQIGGVPGQALTWGALAMACGVGYGNFKKN